MYIAVTSKAYGSRFIYGSPDGSTRGCLPGALFRVRAVRCFTCTILGELTLQIKQSELRHTSRATHGLGSFARRKMAGHSMPG